MYGQNQNNENVFSVMPNSISKMQTHTRGKWLIPGTKHRKDSQLQSLVETPCGIT